MRTFLDRVAADILERHDGKLENVTVVFPGKRARLFMNESLLALAKDPIWSPKYTSITQMFEYLSRGTVMETVPAVIRLYNIYNVLLQGKAESLDRFWGWGEIILSDFDDIDKHMVDADKLFRNAEELSQMDTVEYLTGEQRDALQRFFRSFDGDDRTVLQKRFLELWRIMPDLYRNVQCTAGNEQCFPYEGAMQRSVISDSEILGRLDGEMEYCFVGFNMLSDTERELMRYLKKKGLARFYWDYDPNYVNDMNAEAGEFMRQNLKDFGPGELTPEEFGHGSLTYVASSTDSMATRYIPLWLKDSLTEVERETAVILCDEKKLIPVLHSIPDTDGPKDINITMGYPLSTSPVFALMMALVALQTEGWDESRGRFRYTFQKAVERHPYTPMMNDETWHRHIDASDATALVNYLDECVLELFRSGDKTEDGDTDSDTDTDDSVLFTESIYLTHRALQQFVDNLKLSDETWKLEPTTVRRLLRRMLASLSVPFHGEPAVGLQVMGLLETRCLDFKNILILNAEEGLMPAQQNDSSLIPNTLRIGFGLTTVRHRTAVFAYYFYRLLQRAENVTMVYNQTNSGVTHHEMSRFLRQLQAETDLPIRMISLEAGQEVEHQAVDDVEKSEAIMQRLYEMYDRSVNREAKALSPSALNIYLDCPMKFYLHALCGLTPKDDPEDGVDARTMGNIIHNIAEAVYRRIGTDVTPDKITAFTKDKGKLLQEIIDEEFFREAQVNEYRGENVLIRSVVEQYVLNLLRWDAGLGKFEMLCMEESAYIDLDVQVDEDRAIRIATGGRIDRMDRVAGTVRIVDYKTGAHENCPRKIDDLFTRNSSHAGYWLQTFLYAIAAKRRWTLTGCVRPVLFYVGRAKQTSKAEDRYDPSLRFGKGNKDEIPVNDIADYEQEYIDGLKDLVREIFDRKRAFSKCEDGGACRYCDFCTLCGR